LNYCFDGGDNAARWKPEECFLLFFNFLFFHSFGEFLRQLYKKRKKEKLVHLHIDSLSGDLLLFQLVLLLLLLM
jgi:hypothetical protein